MTKLTDFIAKHGLKMSSEQVDSNPNMEDADRYAHHFRCTLRCAGRRMSIHFTQGSAISGDPTLASVLDCLASDAAGYDTSASFEEWASEYGYDTDSRKAERTYRAVERESARLKSFLGEDLYRALLWDTERRL